MLLVSDFDWTVMFAALAFVGFAAAAIAIAVAVRNGRRGKGASSRLDMIQRAAAASDRRLFQILDAIPVALVQTDGQGRFIFANRSAHQLLGRRDAELLGLRFHAATWGIVFPDGRPIPADMMPSARALRGQTVKGFQHLMANPTTRRKMLVSVTAMPVLDDGGQVVGSTAAIVETAALTGADVQTAATLPSPIEISTTPPRDGAAPPALDPALAADFAALLAVVTGALETIERQAEAPDRVRRLARVALGAGRKGEAMARRLAALSVGAEPPEQPLDVGDLLRGLEGRLRNHLPEHLDLLVDTPPGRTPMRIDPVALESVVSALVANAVQAGAASLAVRLERAGDGLTLTVQDDGPGMDAETARRAAEAFFTTREGSAGLGLTQAATLAETMNGRLTLDTSQGQGLRVTLSLSSLAQGSHD